MEVVVSDNTTRVGCMGVGVCVDCFVIVGQGGVPSLSVLYIVVFGRCIPGDSIRS